MEYKKIDCNSYMIHAIKTDKFKTVHMEVLFRNKVIEEDLPKYTILADLLTDCSNKYPTRQEMEIRKEELYKLVYYGVTTKVGNEIFVSFVSEFIDPKYINDKDYTKGILDFIFGCLNKPLVKNREFDNKIFSNIKNKLLSDIESTNDLPDRKAILNAILKALPNSTTSYRTLGTKELVEKITPENLYAAYEELFNSFVCDIFLIGDINDEFLNDIKAKFKNRVIKDNKLDFIVKNETRKKVQMVKEVDNNLQSNVVLIYNIDYELNKETNAKFQTFNNILCSGGLSSILYQKVREENSLCYAIKSLYMKYDGILLIHLQTDPIYVDKAVDLIRKSIDEIKHGKLVDEKLLQITKNNLKMLIESSLDNNVSILNNYIFNVIDDNPLYDEKINLIESIRVNDMFDCAKKLKLNTIYVLGAENK